MHNHCCVSSMRPGRAHLPSPRNVCDCFRKLQQRNKEENRPESPSAPASKEKNPQLKTYFSQAPKCDRFQIAREVWFSWLSRTPHSPYSREHTRQPPRPDRNRIGRRRAGQDRQTRVTFTSTRGFKLVYPIVTQFRSSFSSHWFSSFLQLSSTVPTVSGSSEWRGWLTGHAPSVPCVLSEPDQCLPHCRQPALAQGFPLVVVVVVLFFPIYFSCLFSMPFSFALITRTPFFSFLYATLVLLTATETP